MTRQYKFTAEKARKFNKYGVDLTVYGENVPEANVVYVSVKKGHLAETYDAKSWFIYYIVKVRGTFVLNDQKIEVKPTDLITIPPKTRLHYFGTMEMVLTVAPAFDEKNERRVRKVSESESPYYKKK